jgi:hypothetical protein
MLGIVCEDICAVISGSLNNETLKVQIKKLSINVKNLIHPNITSLYFKY